MQILRGGVGVTNASAADEHTWDCWAMVIKV